MSHMLEHIDPASRPWLDLTNLDLWKLYNINSMPFYSVSLIIEYCKYFIKNATIEKKKFTRNPGGFGFD